MISWLAAAPHCSFVFISIHFSSPRLLVPLLFHHMSLLNSLCLYVTSCHLRRPPEELLQADPNTLEATGSVLRNALGERPEKCLATFHLPRQVLANFT